MGSTSLDQSYDHCDPLEAVEQVIAAHDWPYNRSAEGEITVSVAGTWCDYHLCFSWRDEHHALHLSCAFDTRVPERRKSAVWELLALVNERLWIGHFDLWSGEYLPMFRHTLLFADGQAESSRQCENLIEIAISECERFYPSFQFVIWAGKTPDQAIAASLFETAGEA